MKGMKGSCFCCLRKHFHFGAHGYLRILLENYLFQDASFQLSLLVLPYKI